MRKAIFFGLVAIVSQTVPAFAAILPATWTPWVRNTYRDESVESIVDFDANNVFTSGDVLYGFIQIVAKTTPNAVAIDPSGPGSLYAAFALQVNTITMTPLGGFNQYTITYNPVSNPLATFFNGNGVTMSQLTGVANPNAIAAVFEGVATNLFTSSPGDVNGDGQVDTRDYVKDASMASAPDLILGFDFADNPADSWTSTFLVPAGVDPLATLSNHTLFNNSSPLGINDFSADLSVLGGSLALLVLNNATQQTDPNDPNFLGLFDLTVQAGNVLGANDIQGPWQTNPWFKSISDGAGHTYQQYGGSDHAQFNFTPDVPEPISLAVWCLLIGTVGCAVWARRWIR